MIASSFLVTLFSMALVPLSRAASAWDKCTAVSYNTLHASKDPTHVPFLGPWGLYAATPNKECVYVKATPESDFARHNPKEFADFMVTVEKLQAEASMPLNLEFLSTPPAQHAAGRHRRSEAEPQSQSAATPGRLFARAQCGDICGGNWDPSYVCTSCGCNIDQLICVDENTCTAVFRCK